MPKTALRERSVEFLILIFSVPFKPIQPRTDSVMQQLKPLPYPVYFVNPESQRWSDLLTCHELPADLKSVYERWALLHESKKGQAWA